MSSQRFVAIILIFVVASTAWVGLGRTLQYRTANLEESLSKEVNKLWGPENLVQSTPFVYSSGDDRKSGDSSEPLGTTVSVHFDHHNRYKGLLWFSTYAVNFSGQYVVQASEVSGGTFAFPLPAGADFVENLKVTIDGETIDPVQSAHRSQGSKQLLVSLPSDSKAHQVMVSYITRGRDSWRYALSHRDDKQIPVKNFSLTATTNFRKIDYPDDCKSPDPAAKPISEGMQAVWKFNKVWMNQDIGIEMPARQNAGPIAARMSFFAPVSLLFFFTALFTVVVLKKIPLHPMHYMFIAAGFFAFHILLAYLADLIDVQVAFWICAGVSVFLVVSYMRLVAGMKFAATYVAAAQLAYLVGFSYAFFWVGKTGLTVTIGAIVTLLVLMQATGRVDWHEVFRLSSRKRAEGPGQAAAPTASPPAPDAVDPPPGPPPVPPQS